VAPPPAIAGTATPEDAEASECPEPKPEPPKPFDHGGFVTELQLGLQGCVGAVCGPEQHDATPGFRLDGFFGSNVRGFVEIGLSGGFGTLGTRFQPDVNVLSLYGVDVALLEQILAYAGGLLPVDLSALNVQDARGRVGRVGPLFRIHFIPRGRFMAFVGAGVGYSFLRFRYTLTSGDPLRLDFHGIDVPIEAGGAYFVHRNVAIGLQFRYLWSRYYAAYITHPQQSFAAPIRLLDEAMAVDGASLQQDLPQFWMLLLSVRARI